MIEMEKITEKQLIALAQLAYGEGMPDTYELACKHEVGDGLADFIVIELHEGTEGEKDRLARAIEVMNRARDQISAVYFILQDAQSAGFEVTKKAWLGE